MVQQETGLLSGYRGAVYNFYETGNEATGNTVKIQRNYGSFCNRNRLSGYG